MLIVYTLLSYNPLVTDEELYNNPEGYDPRNSTVKTHETEKTYTAEDPVMNTVNESYNYPAKYDPSNSIEAKENEAYAMSITTEKNEVYKPVVNVSGECDEYTTIFSTQHTRML